MLYSPKGADRAILLLSKLDKEKRPPLYWIANGCDPTYLDFVKTYSKSLGVEFIPLINISDNELIEKLSRAMFMLYTPRLEPFGLAPLEANACGTFVIGIAEGGVRESITDNENGFLISSVNDERFMEYAELLLDNMIVAIEKGRQARNFVVNNWSNNKLKTNIIKSLVNFNKNPSQD